MHSSHSNPIAGFTLIEVLLVVGVLGSVLAIGNLAFQMQSSVDNSRSQLLTAFLSARDTARNSRFCVKVDVVAASLKISSQAYQNPPDCMGTLADSVGGGSEVTLSGISFASDHTVIFNKAGATTSTSRIDVSYDIDGRSEIIKIYPLAGQILVD